MPNTMYILRGISGSGKSTYIKKVIGEKENVVCSADQYFMKNEEYVFNARLLSKAHDASKDKCIDLCKKNTPIVVVDNTCTQLWEFESYIKIATNFGYKVKVIRLICDPDVAFERNSHGVPLNAVKKMHSRFQDYESEVIVDTTNGYKIVS